MTKKLSTYLEETIVPAKASIHDCRNTVGVQTLSSGVRTLYTNDKAAYEYKSGSDLWDSVNSVINDTIQDSKIDVIVGGVMSTATANNRMLVEIEIDSPVPTPVKQRTIPLTRNGVDLKEFLTFNVYNGALALQYGFKIYLTAEVADIEIKDKNILIRV